MGRVGISEFFVNPKNLGINIWQKKGKNYDKIVSATRMGKSNIEYKCIFVLPFDRCYIALYYHDTIAIICIILIHCNTCYVERSKLGGIVDTFRGKLGLFGICGVLFFQLWVWVARP